GNQYNWDRPICSRSRTRAGRFGLGRRRMSVDGFAETAVGRRQIALHEKLRSLDREAEAWTAMPATPGLQIHTSQIEAVTGGLRSFHALIAAEIDAAEYPAGRPPYQPKPQALSLDALLGFERQILAALEIWNAYRAKFSFRLLPEQRQTLSLM